MMYWSYYKKMQIRGQSALCKRYDTLIAPVKPQVILCIVAIPVILFIGGFYGVNDTVIATAIAAISGIAGYLLGTKD